ncbi:amidohydrolase family protein [Aeromicrobium sp.]|uniref:amidohydrolase family protein n=1 Tax=Aeromicrobium sp. TaxID=1871063 RepID=UPI003D6B05F2
MSVAEHVQSLGLVDHHVHGAWRTDGDEDRLANALAEASAAPVRRPTDAWDSQVGFAVRRWCSEILDLPRHSDPGDYWARRAELGEAEVRGRFLAAAGVETWLVDTGFATGELLTPAEQAAASGADAHEVVRLETLAEALVAEPEGADDFAARFAGRLASLAPGVVAAKSVLAYRSGFDHDLSRPMESDVDTAAVRWREAVGDTSPRLTDVTLIAHAMHVALELGLPLQVHTGLGDSDLRLDRANPVLLTDFLRATESAGVPVLLLHCFPYEREAGYLAQAFEHVHLDVGLAVNHLGVRSCELVARSLELAPFGKVLYSSDACGPPELHFLGARLWRTALTQALDEWVARDDWSIDDACRVASMIGRDNALRVYGLPRDSGTEPQ